MHFHPKLMVNICISRISANDNIGITIAINPTDVYIYVWDNNTSEIVTNHKDKYIFNIFKSKCVSMEVGTIYILFSIQPIFYYSVQLVL